MPLSVEEDVWEEDWEFVPDDPDWVIVDVPAPASQEASLETLLKKIREIDQGILEASQKFQKERTETQQHRLMCLLKRKKSRQTILQHLLVRLELTTPVLSPLQESECERELEELLIR
jgi:hypothetical protein